MSHEEQVNTIIKELLNEQWIWYHYRNNGTRKTHILQFKEFSVHKPVIYVEACGTECVGGDLCHSYNDLTHIMNLDYYRENFCEDCLEFIKRNPEILSIIEVNEHKITFVTPEKRARIVPHFYKNLSYEQRRSI
jgi:hypothetical protein